MLIQAVNSAQPFFSNDLAGLIKVVILFGGVAASIIAAVWQFMKGKLTTADADLQEQINGVGSRVDEVKMSCTQTAVRLDGAEDRISRQEEKAGQMQTNIGELKAKVDQMILQGVDNKIEIIAAFQSRTGEIMNSVHLLDKQLGQLQSVVAERERVRP